MDLGFFFFLLIKGLYKIPSSILGPHRNIYQDNIFNLLKQFAFLIYFYTKLWLPVHVIEDMEHSVFSNSKGWGFKII